MAFPLPCPLRGRVPTIATGPPALRCSWTTVTDSELRLHRAQVGSLFRMFFYVFVRKTPWAMA